MFNIFSFIISFFTGGVKNWIWWVVGIVGIVIVAFGITWVIGVKSEIRDLKEENSNLKVENLMQKNNVLKLQNAINESNAALDKIKVDNEKTIAEFEEWKKRPPEIKYVEVVKEIMTTKYDKATCEEGIKLNKMISELDYDKL